VITFRDHRIASDLKGGYQVVAADMNRDGRPDLIALGLGMSELVWYENPGWQRRVITGGLSRMVNVYPADVDGDGIPELVLASGFDPDPAKSAGNISVLKRRSDPGEPWQVTEIDRLPTSHRIRWADIDGGGSKVAVNLPLAGARAVPPEYRDRVPLVFYRPGGWKRELISEEIQGIAHGFKVFDWDGDGRDEIVTASFEGVHLFRRGSDGRWRSTRLAAGDPSPWPKSGASEIAAGRLGRQRFLSTIEPWHGHQVVVYHEKDGKWERSVIDDSFVEGHAHAVADLDNDGRDEIIAGYRGAGGGVYVYSAADDRGERWVRRALDAGGIPASSCAVADFNGDGRPDIACIGGSLLKWYENAGTLR